ncbi:MAG: hypothetical protein HOP33_20860 [Verrucomicrobia bacterium]|nr:hypothetical protein [Verrucomicrobiota bacterium]
MHSSLENLTAVSLQELSACEGVDFATAVLFDRFCKSARHGGFIRQIDGLRKAPPPQKLPDTRVVIVPGALYIERPELGGDGRLVRGVAERFGYETDLIPLASFGAVTTNARLICDWLHKYRRQRMILVSLSKGSADLKLALESPEAGTLFRNAVAWVNVCGPLNGTRMANWIFDSRLRSWCFRAKCFLQRRDFGLITDLRCASDAPLAKAVQLPPAMQMLSLVGFPLRQDMTTQHSRFCHRTLAAWGPNDGTTSLADLVTWPGNIYPVWGADHYFKPETLASELIAALLHYIAETPQAI